MLQKIKKLKKKNLIKNMISVFSFFESITQELAVE